MVGLMLVAASAAGQTPVVNEDFKILASDAAAQDWFGFSVSISGDTAIIGATGDDDAGDGAGSAYIFRFDGSTWSEEAKLTASDGGASDLFGSAVSISGDTAIIGAWRDADGGDGSGSAYIFRFDGSTWSEEAKLTAFDGAVGDHFGVSVSISGDTAIVAADSDDDAGSNSGSAYIFRFDGSMWTEEAKLTASDAAAFDFFGNSVSISGDVAIIGALFDDDAGSWSGSAYIFRFDGAMWTEEAKLAASDGAAADFFGGSVSISGDTAIVGARSDDDAGSSSGSTYIFRFDGSTWSEESKLTASDAAIGDQFGSSVSISGDAAIVGAEGDDDAGSNSGSAYIFRFDGSMWTEEAKLTASDGAAFDGFGFLVSISGDTALIGAPGDDDAGSDFGSCYIVNLTVDSDSDGLSDDDELALGADPFNPDTDGDGLLDGVEVNVTGSDPLNPDTDGDTLSDGFEVLISGTNPLLADSDGDGLPDPIDPQPLEPDTSSGALEDATRALAEYVATLDVAVFDAPNDNAGAGRRNSLATRLTTAANAIAAGDTQSAIALLGSAAARLDGESPPNDWMLPSSQTDIVHISILALIAALM